MLFGPVDVAGGRPGFGLFGRTRLWIAKTDARRGEIRYTPEYVAERCRTLADYGLIRYLGNGVYEITERGEQYLRGECDTADVEPQENK